MDQIHNHYHGPITVQGANFQSHYVPAEKPYAVYVYVWEGPTAAHARLMSSSFAISDFFCLATDML